MATVTLTELSEFLASQGLENSIDPAGGNVAPGDIRLHAVNTLDAAGRGEISFLANPRYADQLANTQADVVVVRNGVTVRDGLTALRCEDPYAAITAAIVRIHGRRAHPQWGVHHTAVIAESAQLGDGANVGPAVTVGHRAVIGQDATIYPGCYVADGVVMGRGVTLFPNVVIYDGVRIGDRVTVHAGTVIGEDGLGYAPVEGAWHKIPQVGRLVIEDDVELGALCAIDRATLGETRIGKGSKFSNQVVVGHGAKVGEHCMIVAQVGIAGSTVVGDRVTLAGQVGISGHLSIGDGARVGAKSGVHSNIPPGTEYLGSPAIEIAEFRRQNSLVRKLPKMKERLRALEKQVAELREALKHADHAG